jgi:acetyl esterase
MPLEPQARALIDMLDAMSAPVETLSPAEARQASTERRTANPVAILAVHEVVDRVLAGPAGELPVRIYRPSPEPDLPVIVFFHGGGWVLCDLDSHDPVCRLTANEVGAVVVSVDYRLAPEHRYPAAPEDCYFATEWVSAHASELGVDPNRLAVMGDSAGGNLAAVVALMARDRGGPAVAFQSLIYPVADHDFETASYRENATDYFLTTAGMKYYWDHYVAPEQRVDAYVSPLRAPDLSGLPPAHVITAQYDPLRDEGMAYAARLAAAGVPVQAKIYDDAFHGFFNMGGALPIARLANAEVFAVLREALLASPVQSPSALAG